MGNNVLLILKDYLSWEKVKKEKNYNNLSFDEKNNLRLENDKDAKFYYEVMKLTKEKSLFADTIISFWSIYKRLLELEAGWKSYKTIESLKALIKKIESNEQDDCSRKIRALNEKIDGFANLIYTKGNFMLLPDRGMNSKRYEICEDRIDITIFECFPDGKMSNFFKSYDSFEEWINDEKLNFLFLDNNINKENINWFIKDTNKKISEMSKDEVYKYITKAKLLITRRNIDYILMLVNKYHDSHCEDKEVLITIKNTIDPIPELRSKKLLIENFISGINDVDDVMAEWSDYVNKNCEEEILQIIDEENLKGIETRRFIENALRDGEIKTTGTEIDKLMPAVSRFGGGSRAAKKQIVIDKLKSFFEKYYGIGGLFADEKPKIVNYDVDSQKHLGNVSEKLN